MATGTYSHPMGAVSALFFYCVHPAVESHDYDVPSTPMEIEIQKVFLTDDKVTIEVTSCIEELCGLNLAEIENQIMESYDRE